MVNAIAELERGRESYARRAWAEAFGGLSHADQAAPLGPEDLELLATSAYMLGRDGDYLGALERAHHAHLEAGETLPAARCAIWHGLQLSMAGEMARASGWLGRAQRLVERAGRDCVEQGYLLLPMVFRHEAGGDFAAAAATAGEAAAIGERLSDPDLFALAVHAQGQMLVSEGRVEDGLPLLDEAMVAVSAGEVSPIVSGLVYCGVILACRDAHEPRRAREWTAALTTWCEQQPDMVAFTGRCLVHRAEILQLDGAWADALVEAGRAQERCVQGNNEQAAGEAAYRQGEVHRLRGEQPAAEGAYREASRYGREPQPGLALLRLAQRKRDAAVAAIRRVVAETGEPMRLAGLLPAKVEIMLAVGELDEARGACAQLAEIATAHPGGDAVNAISLECGGAVALADGDWSKGLAALRPASELWRDLGARYECARTRVLVGLACRGLGDEDAAELELGAAREVFEGLGAEPDVARVDALAGAGARAGAHGLTPRELEVLRLVAAGQTNKAIAAELVVSERTVDRHVSNIFTKLRVSTRAAATAYAYEHELL